MIWGKQSGYKIPTVHGRKIPPPGVFFGIFHIKSSYLHEHGVGTDTTGPGEAVFATSRRKFKAVKRNS